MPNQDPPASSQPKIPPAGPVPAFYSRRRKRGDEICQILLRNHDVRPEDVRRALRIQEERGGQVGRILVKMGACSERAIARALKKQVQLAHARGREARLSALARQNPEVVGLHVTFSAAKTAAALVATDVVSLLFVGGVVTGLDRVLSGGIARELLTYNVPALVLLPVVYAMFGLYDAAAPSPPEEIRRVTVATTATHAGILAVVLLGMQRLSGHAVLLLVGAWSLALFAVPIARAVARRRFRKRPWWGCPVAVLGAGKTGRALVRALQQHPELGLRAVMILDDDVRKQGTLRASISDHDIQMHSVRDVPVASSSLRDLPDVASARFQAVAADTTLSSSSSPDSSDSSTDDEEAPPTVRSTIPPTPPKTNGAGSVSSRPPPPLAAPSSAKFAAAPPSKHRMPPAAPSSRRFFDAAPSSRRFPAAPSARAIELQPPSSAFPLTESSRPRGVFAEVEGVPVIGGLELAPLLGSRLGIRYAIVAMPGVNSRRLLQVIERVGGAFSHLLLIPDLFGFGSIGAPVRSVSGVLGVEVRQQLLLKGPRLAKRLLDVALTVVGGLMILPIILGLALLIKLDSRGPIMYPQKRLGRDGKRFTAMKFRTMHGDGEKRLKALLESNPKLAAEYAEFHKLSNDPRVTRVGRVLRKYSLDELPQLWNVLVGDMSLVGPRPYIEREIPEMQQQEGIILRAMPGMTGMWQVSDRNATGFAERVKMDVHYVRNWSPWMDIYILARTFGVVINGTGS